MVDHLAVQELTVQEWVLVITLVIRVHQIQILTEDISKLVDPLVDLLKLVCPALSLPPTLSLGALTATSLSSWGRKGTRLVDTSTAPDQGVQQGERSTCWSRPQVTTD